MTATFFAPVAPIWLLEQLTEEGSDYIGSYHLLLAHDVLAQRDRFANWANDLRSRFSKVGTEVTIIMDSSVIELGHPLEMAECVEAGRVVNADVVVLPDIIGDHKATLDYVYTLEAYIADNTVYSEFMFVPQGRCIEEYVASLECVAYKKWIQWIGLPRDALKFMPSRQALVAACKIVCPDKKIHMLGFSDNLLDDFWCCRSKSVIGIDSAVPVRAGMKNTRFRLSQDDYGKREDYWTNEKPVNHMTIDNISQTRVWLA
jgi:hypothetical protein